MEPHYLVQLSGHVTNDKMFGTFISDILKQLFILKPLFTVGVLSLDKKWPSEWGP